MMMILLLLQLAAPPSFEVTYFPETQESLRHSTHRLVQVSGTVTSNDIEDYKKSFRLVDDHGHGITCRLPKGWDHPKVGTAVIVSGTRKLWQATGVVEIDPVAKVVPVDDQ